MKKLLIAALVLGTTAAAQAQRSEQQLSLSAGGGLHQLTYDLNDGTRKGGTGFSFGAGYTFFFSPCWGISTGIGVQTFRSTATLDLLTKTPDTDSEGDSYELRTRYTSWEEEQSATLIDIPLAATYRYALSPKLSLTASAGAKISIPIKSTYKTTSGTIVTTGYYKQWDVELSDVPEQGLRTYEERTSGDITLRPAVALLAEAGASYQLSNAVSLYTGIYTSYGLNDMLKPDTKAIYQKDGHYNGLFASDAVSKVRPIAAGLKLSVIWNITRSKRGR